MLVHELFDNVEKGDDTCRKVAGDNWDALTHPPKSLGWMEQVVGKLASIYADSTMPEFKKAHILFAADNGIALDHKVSAVGCHITHQMVRNFCMGGAAINVLCNNTGTELRIIDIGVDYDFGFQDKLLDYKVRKGTNDFSTATAMGYGDMLQAIQYGSEVAEQLIEEGFNAISLGEMGIGNTSTSAAIISAVTGHSPRNVAGIGSGLNAESIDLKVNLIIKALELHKLSQGTDPLTILRSVGGLDIAGMVGAIFTCVQRRIPVFLDGVITSAAALIAYKINNNVKDYLIATHTSADQGHGYALGYLGMKPPLQMGMRLGEGTGAVVGMANAELAIALYSQMAEFADSPVKI